mmetsp:Transcript_5779/g.16222  ORF Transcript_5779/g.16222 Transcript_5779/m.16222 type:complete len:294 (-) Transcript_5779:184-1065(-)
MLAKIEFGNKSRAVRQPNLNAGCRLALVWPIPFLGSALLLAANTSLVSAASLRGCRLITRQLMTRTLECSVLRGLVLPRFPHHVNVNGLLRVLRQQLLRALPRHDCHHETPVLRIIHPPRLPIIHREHAVLIKRHGDDQRLARIILRLDRLTFRGYPRQRLAPASERSEAPRRFTQIRCLPDLCPRTPRPVKHVVRTSAFAIAALHHLPRLFAARVVFIVSITIVANILVLPESRYSGTRGLALGGGRPGSRPSCHRPTGLVGAPHKLIHSCVDLPVGLLQVTDSCDPAWAMG